MKDKTQTNTVQDTIPIAEWIVAAVGTALVAATVAFLVYRALAQRSPPSFTTEIENLEVVDGVFSVSIQVQNTGGRPVSKLVVRATRDGNDQRELTIDFLPAHSARTVTFRFDEPISADQFRCSLTSYNEP